MSFKNSLSIGALGETLYFQAHRKTIERLDGRKADFKIIKTGEFLELKTDTWDMAETPNFFIEAISNKSKQSPGGPFQAKKNKCKYYVYFFIKNLTYFIFKTEDLIQYIEEVSDKLKVIEIPNSGWITQGFLINRESVKHLYTVEKMELKCKKSKTSS